MKASYTSQPNQVLQTKGLPVHVFSTNGENIDLEVVEAFGEEWLKFKDYSEEEIKSLAIMYFDILNETILNKNSYVLEIGCGTGRWSKYLASRAGFIEAVDPSNAVIAASILLKDVENIRITKASIETLPFEKNTFDFAMSIGVLHHIPDTQQAMKDCVQMLKPGGYFYCYLYYDLDSKGKLFKSIFKLSDVIRKKVSRMPSGLKKITCDVLAVSLYMPFILTSRGLKKFGFTKLSEKIPLSDYADKSFFIIRNDSLDRFGTSLEQRFSKEQVIAMMKESGLNDIVVSPNSPYYHAVGRK